MKMIQSYPKTWDKFLEKYQKNIGRVNKFKQT